MEPIVVKPEKELKTLWFISWSIPFVIGLVTGIFLMFILDYPGNLISGLSIVGWLMLMLPILFWIPAFHRSLEYVIDSDSIKGKKGSILEKTSYCSIHQDY
jgi:membrane protein YdbS with pleckstrin-like domain